MIAGDTTSMLETMKTSLENVVSVVKMLNGSAVLESPAEWVADKGYHSNDTMEVIAEIGARSYVSEPKRGKRRWHGRDAARDATYGNRRRLRGDRCKALMRKRGELIERSFAHCLESGGMRRTHLRGQENILKRYPVHVAGFNLSLVMRPIFGVGKPRGLQDQVVEVCAELRGLAATRWMLVKLWIVDQNRVVSRVELRSAA